MKRSCATLVLFLAVGAANAAGIQSLDSIEAAVGSFVTAAVASGDDVEFTIGRLDPRLRLAQCEQALNVRNTHAARQRGPMSVEVRCAGNKPWVLYVPVELVRYAEVAVTRTPVARGQALTEADLHLERRRIDPRQADYLTDPAVAYGQVATRAIGPGQIVSQRLLRRPRLVRRGDQVVLSIGTRSVTVRAKGEALQDGAAGERITVLNLSSDRIIQGVVSATGEVVVRTGTML